MIGQEITRLVNQSEKKGRFIIQELDDEVNVVEKSEKTALNYAEKYFTKRTKHTSICKNNKIVHLLHNQNESPALKSSFSTFIYEENSNNWVDFDLIWRKFSRFHCDLSDFHIQKIFNYPDLKSEQNSSSSSYFNDSFTHDNDNRGLNSNLLILNHNLQKNKNANLVPSNDNITNIQTTHDVSHSNIAESGLLMSMTEKIKTSNSIIINNPYNTQNINYYTSNTNNLNSFIPQNQDFAENNRLVMHFENVNNENYNGNSNVINLSNKDIDADTNLNLHRCMSNNKSKEIIISKTENQITEKNELNCIINGNHATNKNVNQNQDFNLVNLESGKINNLNAMSVNINMYNNHDNINDGSRKESNISSSKYIINNSSNTKTKTQHPNILLTSDENENVIIRNIKNVYDHYKEYNPEAKNSDDQESIFRKNLNNSHNSKVLAQNLIEKQNYELVERFKSSPVKHKNLEINFCEKQIIDSPAFSPINSDHEEKLDRINIDLKRLQNKAIVNKHNLSSKKEKKFKLRSSEKLFFLDEEFQAEACSKNRKYSEFKPTRICKISNKLKIIGEINFSIEANKGIPSPTKKLALKIKNKKIKNYNFEITNALNVEIKGNIIKHNLENQRLFKENINHKLLESKINCKNTVTNKTCEQIKREYICNSCGCKNVIVD